MNGIVYVNIPLMDTLGAVPIWQWRYVMSHLIAIVVSGFLLWLAINRLEWYRLAQRQYSQSQEALFAQLCRKHNLSRADRLLLSQIAQTKGPNQYCLAFIDQRLIQQFAQNNPGASQNCLELCRRLFGNDTSA